MLRIGPTDPSTWNWADWGSSGEKKPGAIATTNATIYDHPSAVEAGGVGWLIGSVGFRRGAATCRHAFA